MKNKSSQKNNIENHFKITQIKSSIGKKYDQRQTLIGLGLNRMNKVVILKCTDSIKGMIKKVNHLIKIEIIN